MDYFLPTRDEARAIVEKSEAFYVSEREVQGFKVEMYDYRLASYTDFESNNAYELRGLTFVLNPETGEWERHLALNKFFNVNQTGGLDVIEVKTNGGKVLYKGYKGTDEHFNSTKVAIPQKETVIGKTISWMYEDVKHKRIVNVSDKRDGSMITFVKLPNGNVVAKTKMSFVSEQAEMAQKFYDENENYRKMIDIHLSMGLTDVFEITSPHNQIVLNYNDTELTLLQVRDHLGEYKNAKYMAIGYGVPYADGMPESFYNLDVLLKLKETEEGIEGYVVTFEDGQMAKIKTEWYMQLHGLVTEGTRENLLIKTILDDNIDDVLSQLTETSEKRTFIENTTLTVTSHFNHHVALIKEKLLTFDEKLERRIYVETHKSYEYFSVLMRLVGREIHELAVEEGLKEVILKKTNGLAKAQEFLTKIR